MSRVGYGFLALLIAALSFALYQQQHPLVSRTRFDAGHFDQEISLFIQERSITGVGVAVTYDDRLVYAAGHGYADHEAKINVTVHDRFRVASVSKAIEFRASLVSVASPPEYALSPASLSVRECVCT